MAIKKQPVKKAAKKTVKKAAQVKTVGVKIVPDRETSPGRVYSNYMAMTQSPYDFTLRFCDAPPIWEEELEESVKNMELKIPVVAEIVIPFDMVPGIINALGSQYEKHLEKKEEGKNGGKKQAPKK